MDANTLSKTTFYWVVGGLTGTGLVAFSWLATKVIIIDKNLAVMAEKYDPIENVHHQYLKLRFRVDSMHTHLDSINDIEETLKDLTDQIHEISRMLGRVKRMEFQDDSPITMPLGNRSVK